MPILQARTAFPAVPKARGGSSLTHGTRIAPPGGLDPQDPTASRIRSAAILAPAMFREAGPTSSSASSPVT
jgi:hypothetical protein